MGLFRRRPPANFQNEIDKWKTRAEQYRAKALELEAALFDSQRDNERLKSRLEDGDRERATLERLLARLSEQSSSMLARMDSMMGQVITIASRPPQIHDPTAAIKEIGEVLANILVGREGTVPNSNPGYDNSADIAMDRLGFDGTAGVPPGTFFPLTEFDPTMEESSQWPTPGVWRANTTPSSLAMQTTGQELPTTPHVIVGDQVMRTDGTPLFQAGTTGPPPVGGLE